MVVLVRLHLIRRKHLNRVLLFGAVIVTKMDGHAKGGGALSA